MAEPYNVVAVPGSTSNLGPAFDALSVALDSAPARPRARRPRGSRRRVRVRVRRTGADRRESDRHRLSTACQRFGRPVMGLRVRVSSEIPMAAGLGSSAAATIAGAPALRSGARDSARCRPISCDWRPSSKGIPTTPPRPCSAGSPSAARPTTGDHRPVVALARARSASSIATPEAGLRNQARARGAAGVGAAPRCGREPPARAAAGARARDRRLRRHPRGPEGPLAPAGAQRAWCPALPSASRSIIRRCSGSA